MTDIDPTKALDYQLDYHWTSALRPRLDGLSDEEYFWEPAPGSWNVRRQRDITTPMRGGAGEWAVEFAFPEPDPAPVTTIAWRLAHIIVGVLGNRVHNHFGGPEAEYETWDYAGSAADALAQLDEQYGAWITGVRSLSEADLAGPCGDAEGPFAQKPMIDLVLHINREVIHHGAEIALLRDLYAHRAAA